MKKVGQILKEARISQGKTLLEIYKETKISENNLKALEKDKYQDLPEAIFVNGFIQTYAKVLGLSGEKLTAIFRRDGQKKEKVLLVPLGLKKSLLKGSFFWNPKTAVVLLGFFLITIFSIYLGIQIKGYFSPPKLSLDLPLEGQIVVDNKVLVKGKTDEDVSLFVNDNLVNLDDKGNFSLEFDLLTDEDLIVVKAQDRRSRETVIERKLKVVDK
ncbi:hypothetical protein COT75_03165 [Candidatus Beckwithbacteria bacterium CG10_big_fil_rev_8_21_14_0_10_34_10]|uniref:HTH cro/C1-type domain-containing protein n=1 Tax=Candidatus Beckwithbacteria bacterium CG10_big_fil_rev_8_21_14_0_10_34_10 TaxID=1974495 RepID=A0A2H0WB53_9BACT|nr:MAG: hypothetical protein COT75_03165 [Candidatus Beckwithbacteria bacterium CG10_big_fil_rev_8_21_14_0_10_34_10]